MTTNQEPTTAAIAEFHAMREKTYDGPFIWGPSEGTPEEYLAAALKATQEHGDSQAKAYVVQSVHDADDPVTVAYCGNGPRSHRNAALIAHLLGSLPWLLAQAEAQAEQRATIDRLEAEKAALIAAILLASWETRAPHCWCANPDAHVQNRRSAACVEISKTLEDVAASSEAWLAAHDAQVAQVERDRLLAAFDKAWGREVGGPSYDDVDAAIGSSLKRVRAALSPTTTESEAEA